MANYRKRAVAASAAAALTVALAACGGGSDDNSSEEGGNASAAKGGTLNYFIYAPIEHVDPQRIYVGRDISNFGRTVYRSLVTFPASDDATEASTPVPDLATDTGTATEGGKVWSFTLKDGIKWEDGSEITCEDFKYGASRVFAQDVITGGPNYIVSYLDIPQVDGEPAYKGPYTGEGQEHFDKAITCDGKTITYRFNKPWPDFPLAVAGLHMMDPYKQSEDEGDKSNFKIFSNGPYKLEGTWNKDSGGTLVRNENYDAATDSTDIRKALPDKIAFKIGQTSEVIYDQLIADSGEAQTGVTGQRVPPAYFSQITGPVEERLTTVESPYVDYLVPNFNSPDMKNPKVREALAAATNIDAWIAAGGGEKAYVPAESIVNPSVVGYEPNPAFAGPNSGDVEKAKQLLAEAGVSNVEIKFTYPQSDTADKQAAALKQTWDEAGFKTVLDPLGDTYYDVVQKPGNDSDVYWAGWGADWPSAITVTPALFSKVNLTKGSNGQNYGAYTTPEFEAAIDKAANAATLDEQTAALQEADRILGEDVAYIPLEIAVFNFLHGSKVANFNTTPASSEYPDLGVIGVKN